MDADPREAEAFAHAEAGRLIKARELAESILERDDSSYIAHLTMGHVYHYAEANLPRALYQLRRARALFEGRYGDSPGPEAPWRWHVSILKELISVHGAMEHHADKLAHIARYNELYDPDMIAERAWPLMKLGKYTEARLAAELGLASDVAGQRIVALNSLCAIEFEAGNDGASYEACKRAMEDSLQRRGSVSAVDLTNFAEASRSMFKLDEAERISLEATTVPPSWYGNPWMELGELYTRQGRFGEALSALRKVPEYRAQRPPHVRNADRNEGRRALASFLLVLARPGQAHAFTSAALDAPERRAHNSRDPAQDRSVLALLDRRALRMQAELELERGATEPFYVRPVSWAKALWLRVEGSRSAARVEKLLSDDARLVGSLRIGTASAAVMPPWLVGELVQVFGAGVIAEALQRARAADERPGADAYYDAVAAEVAHAQGDDARALDLARRSLAALGPSETLLAARVMALAADAARRAGRAKEARGYYDQAFQRDPGIFRRLELPVGVRIEVGGAAVGEEIASMLAGSPRFVSDDRGLTLRIEAEPLRARVCLLGAQNQLVGCAETESHSGEARREHASRAAAAAQEELFAPRIDLSQIDINSLDGSTQTRRGDLDTLLGR
jgi:tetratricopeptide (TPR) repeat protein